MTATETILNRATSPDFDWRRSLTRLAVFPWARPTAHPVSRAHFVLGELRPFLNGSILDVGSGDTAPLFRAELGPSYHALDLTGTYKLKDANSVDVDVDLETGHLPYGGCSYDVDLCTDVLEHVDNIHEVYAELFRIARRTVIVSLPNNWPGFLWSHLAGRNVTHSAGYGLSAQPKPLGQRHKHFFNLEEGSDFLVNARSPEFRVVRYYALYEPGSDGLLFFTPRFGKYLRRAGAVTLERATEKVGAFRGSFAWLLAKTAYCPIRAVDTAIAAIIWGWGNPVRYYNLFARQTWVVLERTEPCP
jgi:SAM-dependent methyltransferase